MLAIQSGEPGPFAQAIAGIDIAVWDLVGRKQEKPLWQLMGGNSPTIPVYASGLNPTSPELLAGRKLDQGYRAFKLKVGFGAERDVGNLDALRHELGPSVELMVDANQAWTLTQAIEAAPRLERFGIAWLEEPLRADRPWGEWDHLKATTKLPLAAGENILGRAGFDEALLSRALSFVQPDLAKWGGFSGCTPVAERIARKLARSIVRTIWAVASGSWHQRICWPAWADAAAWRSMRMTIRCARSCAGLSMIFEMGAQR